MFDRVLNMPLSKSSSSVLEHKNFVFSVNTEYSGHLILSNGWYVIRCTFSRTKQAVLFHLVENTLMHLEFKVTLGRKAARSTLFALVKQIAPGYQVCYIVENLIVGETTLQETLNLLCKLY